MVRCFHVHPSGSDSADGSRNNPLATLAGARDAIRRFKRDGGCLPKGGITVDVAGGEYYCDRTTDFLPEDSGSQDAPIIYRAKKGSSPRFLGGRILKEFTQVNDRDVLELLSPEAQKRLVQCDLKAAGVADFGQLRSRGFGRNVTPAHLELFFDDKPMILARWPNEGEWTLIESVPEGTSESDGHGRTLGSLSAGFKYEGDRPAHWRDTGDLWIHGYWAWEWANTYEKVSGLDTSNKFLRTEPPHGIYGFRPGQRFFFLNVLEELDQPGEYYVDRHRGILYFWPPAPVESAEVMISVMEEPIVSMNNVNHLAFRGLTFECMRGTAIKIAGGYDCRMQGCIIRHTGNHAIVIDGGKGHEVASCDIYDNGDGGVLMNGGDRGTLTSGDHCVNNCMFHNRGRWSRCYAPAIGISGVGLRAANNLIYDHPHIAILFTGNEHLIELNEIHHVCKETGDTGAIYTGRDWTYQGNIIRYNYIHDVREPGWGGSFSIYLDDCVSGIRVEGNIVADSNTGVLMGGGRDCKINNNIFYNCQIGVRIDARGTAESPVWRNMVYKTMKERLDAVNHRQPPYSIRYPNLGSIDRHLALDKGVPPENDTILRNICFGREWLRIGWGATPEMLEIRDNIVDTDGPVGFENAANPVAAGFRLKRDSRALSAGFEPVPFQNIGLFCDKFRRSDGKLRR